MTDTPSLSPREARDRYLKHRQTDARESSIKSWKYDLKLFVEWAEERGIEEMHDVTGWTIEEFETHRRGEDVAPSTLNSEMQTLKTWLEYCARIEVVDPDLPEKVEIPKIPEGDETTDETLPAERAQQIIAAFRADPERYGTAQHVFIELAWWTAARTGAIVGLDLRDYHSDEQFVAFQDRRKTGTPLKNGQSGARAVALPRAVCDVVDEYIATYREDRADEHGRLPLLTTTQGRPSETTVQVWSYLATQPCIYRDCPHGQERDTCDYVHRHRASQCPSSRSPHRFRSGSISWQRDCGLPAEVVAARVDATMETIEKYYDKTSPRERMEQRRRPFLDDLTFDTKA